METATVKVRRPLSLRRQRHQFTALLDELVREVAAELHVAPAAIARLEIEIDLPTMTRRRDALAFARATLANP